ncbi:DUF4810 domain-containing protein [bacterium endosymbiont of Escarpia laminata]|nr:MAG: DUF4810 domain-containing protein [bacterium endosymbiont of Escarpia laminata]
MKLLTFIAVLFIVSGCATTPQPLYIYGDYSDSYYAYKKNIGEESTLKLQQSIEQAIEEAGKSHSGRVPPGMYANLGYIYLKGGNPQKAIDSFKKEKSIYPESAHFMDRVIIKVGLAEGE